MSFSYVGLAVIEAKAIAAVENAVTQSIEDLTAKCMEAAPVDTGTLRASIHPEGPEVSATSVTGKVATGGEANEYAIYVHEGTRKMAGRPFLAGPLVDNAPTYAAALQRAAAGEF